MPLNQSKIFNNQSKVFTCNAIDGINEWKLKNVEEINEKCNNNYILYDLSNIKITLYIHRPTTWCAWG